MKRLVTAFAVMATLVAVPLATSPAGATTFTVKFKLSGAPTGTKVIAIGKSVVKAVAGGSGSTVTMTLNSRFKSGSKYAFSLHLIRSNGKYLGPVVFGVSGSGNSKKFTTNIATTSTSVDAGTISYNSLSPGWAKSSKKFSTASIGKYLLSPGTTGKPKGAGTLGLVKKAGVASASVHSFAGVTCTDTADQELGGDCDADGVVNAIDADDDDDGKLDIADTSTENFPSQKYLPWSTLYLEIVDSGDRQTLNANIGDVTAADIDAAIGGNHGSFAINFYISMSPGTSTNYSAAWIDCGGISYCNSLLGTALTGAPNGNITSLFNDLWCTEENSGGGCESDILWKNYSGTIFSPNNSTASKVSYSGSKNGLTLFYNGSDPVWAGSMIPMSGEGTVDEVRPGDPYTLNLLNASTGIITQYPMSLGAFFLTVPALKEVDGTTVAYGAPNPLGSYNNPIEVGTDGTFSFKFWRPQRAGVVGVDGAADSTPAFMDMGGLQYGLIMGVVPSGSTDSGGGGSALRHVGGGIETGCTSNPSAGIYTLPIYGISRTYDELTEPNSAYWSNLWPLTDISTDTAVSSDRTINLTFDMKKCIQALKVAPANRRATVNLAYTDLVPIQLTAAGVSLTGGSSRAAQTFWVRLPSEASSW